MLEFAAPEIAEVVSGWNNFKIVWEDRLEENIWVVVARKRQRAQSFSQNLQNKPVGRQETFLHKRFTIHVEQFAEPNFCGNFWKSWSEKPKSDNVLSSHENEVYPNSSLNENCIKFAFQTDRNYNVDLRRTYLASKLKFVKGRGYEIYKTKEVKKERKKAAKADEETEEQEPPVLLATHVDKIFAFNFFKQWRNNQKIYNSNGLYAHKFYFSKNSRGHLWIHGCFALRGLEFWRFFWGKCGSAFVWTFSHGENENA